MEDVGNVGMTYIGSNVVDLTSETHGFTNP